MSNSSAFNLIESSQQIRIKSTNFQLYEDADDFDQNKNAFGLYHQIARQRLSTVTSEDAIDNDENGDDDDSDVDSNASFIETRHGEKNDKNESASETFAAGSDSIKDTNNQISNEYIGSDSCYPNSEVDEELEEIDSLSPNSGTLSMPYVKEREHSNEDASDDVKKNISNSVTLQDRKSIMGFKSDFLARQLRKVKSLGRIFDVQINANKAAVNESILQRSRSIVKESSSQDEKVAKQARRKELSHSTSPINMPVRSLQQQQPFILASSSSSSSSSSTTSASPPPEPSTTLFSPPFRRMSISGKKFSSLSLPAAQTFQSISRPGSSMSLRSFVKFRSQSGDHDANIDYLLDKQLELVHSSEVLDRIIIGGVQSSGKSTIFSQMKQIMHGKNHFSEDERMLALNQIKRSYLNLTRILAHSVMDSALVLSSSMEQLADIDDAPHGSRIRISSSVTSTPMLSPLSPSSAQFEASEIVKSKAGKIGRELAQTVADILANSSSESGDDNDFDSVSTQAAQPLIPSHVRNLLSILELVPDNAKVTESILPWIDGSGVKAKNIYEWISMTDCFELILNNNSAEPTIAELIVCVVNDNGIRSFCMNEYKIGRLHNFPLDYMLENASFLLLEKKNSDIFDLEHKGIIEGQKKNYNVDNFDEVVLRAHFNHHDPRTVMIDEKSIELVDLSSDRRKWFSYLSEACKQFLFVVSLDALETVYESVNLFSMIIASPFLKDVARYILVLNKVDCLEQKLQGDNKSVEQIINAIHQSFRNCYEEFIPDGYDAENAAQAKAPFHCMTISAIDRDMVASLVKIVDEDIIQPVKIV